MLGGTERAYKILPLEFLDEDLFSKIRKYQVIVTKKNWPKE